MAHANRERWDKETDPKKGYALWQREIAERERREREAAVDMPAVGEAAEAGAAAATP